MLSEQGPVVNGRARVELTRRAMTDSEGHYQLRAAPGEYLLFVPPLIGSSGVFQIGTEPEIVRDFHVENAPVLQLTGLVVRVGPVGEPVAGAIVEGQPYDTDSGLSRFSSVADVRGRFRAERYRDKMLVAARSRDGALAGLAFIGADDNNVRIAISTAATISGRMIYPDGKPVAEQSVSCLISVDPPDHVVVQGRTPTVIRRRADRCGRPLYVRRHSGRFALSACRFSEDRREVVRGLTRYGKGHARSQAGGRSDTHSDQSRDRISSIDEMRPVLRIMPRDCRRQAERLIDRGCQVLGSLGVGTREPADLVGRADNPASDDSAAGEEDGLDLAPVVAAGELVVLGQRRDSRRAAELAGHHDQCRVEQPTLMQVIKKR